ncbi:MAG: lipid-A-disaccharide synthase, partial [Gammaproteobacteria bacterium]|nr:lipid-A-disaccharide synthase [Gammaproteobacteria bacterium]
EKPLLALMPGSRTNEIKLLAPEFLQAAWQLQQENPGLQLVCNMVTQAKAEIFTQIWQQVAPQLQLTLLIGQARQTLTSADAVLIASGTATLEAMLAKTPMVVAYKANWLTYQIASRLVKVDYFSLPNLLAKQALVPEFLQQQVTVPALVDAMRPLLAQSGSSTQAAFTAIHQQIRCDASTQAAKAVLELLHD